ncbi:hypothetical protein EGH24_04000 [Halonotius terrestris]|uniref:Yip1 domain-containing protein n=1 Tax=Halonotius terrestris TaxID=2487750 RepID=A0A8J8TCQ0_9EURY|nr:YIP1 family protein [Halonotius terrestris]TQQ82623.1 hypothetical protein EGH24_04000 [Halonotius terrestris]
MTTWVETPEGGRSRGPVGIARAWAEVLVRPRRFFTNGVAPGDQAPGLAFAVVVAVSYVVGLLAVQPETILDTSLVPILGGSPALTMVLVVLVTAVVAAPAGLHLTAAIQTVLLMLTVKDRAGVSETVQVVGYATAPCALAWLPFPTLAAACALYGAGLLIFGLAVVHETSLLRAAVAGAVPAGLVFGVAYGGVWALQSVAAAVGL